MLIIFENEFAKVSFEKELKLITITWTNKKINFEEYKKPFLAALKYMDKNKVENYISDIRKQGIVSPNYRKWLQEVAIPEGVKKGLKRIVGVSESNVFKKYYINNVFNSAKKLGIPFKLFSTPEKAKQWFSEFE